MHCFRQIFETLKAGGHMLSRLRGKMLHVAPGHLGRDNKKTDCLPPPHALSPALAPDGFARIRSLRTDMHALQKTLIYGLYYQQYSLFGYKDNECLSGHYEGESAYCEAKGILPQIEFSRPKLHGESAGIFRQGQAYQSRRRKGVHASLPRLLTGIAVEAKAALLDTVAVEPPGRMQPPHASIYEFADENLLQRLFQISPQQVGCPQNSSTCCSPCSCHGFQGIVVSCGNYLCAPRTSSTYQMATSHWHGCYRRPRRVEGPRSCRTLRANGCSSQGISTNGASMTANTCCFNDTATSTTAFLSAAKSITTFSARSIAEALSMEKPRRRMLVIRLCTA